MSSLLWLHELARRRGDGLDPRLVHLLEERAMRETQGIVDLASRDGRNVSGPPSTLGFTESPNGPDFLPGNVVPISECRKPVAKAAKARHIKR